MERTKGDRMAKVIVRARVAYPKSLLEKLREQAPMRTTHGERGASYCALADDLNVGYCIFDWESVESAKSFWASPQGKAHTAEWHSAEKPEILILQDAPSR